MFLQYLEIKIVQILHLIYIVLLENVINLLLNLAKLEENMHLLWQKFFEN
jgi:hypothetical protein